MGERDVTSPVTEACLSVVIIWLGDNGPALSFSVCTFFEGVFGNSNCSCRLVMARVAVARVRSLSPGSQSRQSRSHGEGSIAESRQSLSRGEGSIAESRQSCSRGEGSIARSLSPSSQSRQSCSRVVDSIAESR